MNDAKNFLLKLGIILLATLGPIAAYNLLADPYGVFRKDFSIGLKVEPDQRFIKMRYVLSRPDRYDSFLFGSSRVGNIDTEKIPADRFYNMSYSEGLPAEHLKDIRLMMKSGVKIRRLLIGLDDLSYSIDPKQHENQPMRRAYPGRSGLAFFYLRYLVLVPDLTVMAALASRPRFLNFYDITNSGRVLHKEVDDWIDAHPREHAEDPRFKSAPFRPAYASRTEAVLKEIGQIRDFAGEHGIDLVFFINPVHSAMRLSINQAEFSNFLEKLSAVVPFYDFSGPGPVTSDSAYFYEPSHYRPIVGDMIVGRIYGTGRGEKTAGFGVLVRQTK